jgi:hypothetical protein
MDSNPEPIAIGHHVPSGETMRTDVFSLVRLKLLACHRQARRGGIYPRSLQVALVVGTFLNLVNQPEAFLGRAPLNLMPALLTYAVPFLVATYGAVAARRES